MRLSETLDWIVLSFYSLEFYLLLLLIYELLQDNSCLLLWSDDVLACSALKVFSLI